MANLATEALAKGREHGFQRAAFPTQNHAIRKLTVRIAAAVAA
jgi:hypothetical protein